MSSLQMNSYNHMPEKKALSQKNNLDIRRTLQPLPRYLKRSTNGNGQRIKGWSSMSLITHYYSKNSKQTESLVLSMHGFLATLPTESSLSNVTGLTQWENCHPWSLPRIHTRPNPFLYTHQWRSVNNTRELRVSLRWRRWNSSIKSYPWNRSSQNKF